MLGAPNFYHLTVMYSCSTRHHESLKELRQREKRYISVDTMCFCFRVDVSCDVDRTIKIATETMAYQHAARSSTRLATCCNIAGYRHPYHIYSGEVGAAEQILTLWMRATDTVLTKLTYEKFAYRARSGCRLRRYR
jgi:hypothetical protein